MPKGCPLPYYTTTIYTPHYDKTLTVIRYIPPHVLPITSAPRKGVKTGKRYAPRRDPSGSKERGPSPLSRYFFTRDEEVWYHGTEQESRRPLGTGCESVRRGDKKSRIMAALRDALQMSRVADDEKLLQKEKSRFGGTVFAARFAEQVTRSAGIRAQC